jgi:hypothetical protein
MYLVWSQVTLARTLGTTPHQVRDLLQGCKRVLRLRKCSRTSIAGTGWAAKASPARCWYAADEQLLGHVRGRLHRGDEPQRAAASKIGGADMVIEDQESISAWADQTFGPASSNARVAARANEVMAELLLADRRRQPCQGSRRGGRHRHRALPADDEDGPQSRRRGRAQDGNQPRAAMESHGRRPRLPRP